MACGRSWRCDQTTGQDWLSVSRVLRELLKIDRVKVVSCPRSRRLRACPSLYHKAHTAYPCLGAYWLRARAAVSQTRRSGSWPREPHSYYDPALKRARLVKAIPNLLPTQPGDLPATFADIDELHQAVGYIPQTSLEEGVQRYVEWHRTYYGG